MTSKNSFFKLLKEDLLQRLWSVILAMVVNTFVNIPESIGKAISLFSHKSLSVTLFLIGTGLSLDSLKKTGIKPVLLGVILWVLISVVTLFVVM